MATDQAFAGFSPAGVTRRLPAKKRKKPYRPGASPRELERIEDEERVHRAHNLAMARASRQVAVREGVVWFEIWAELVRNELAGYRVREGLLLSGFTTSYGEVLRRRLVETFAVFGQCTAEQTFWRGKPCVRAYLRVPVSKMGLMTDDAKSRRYFDDES